MTRIQKFFVAVLSIGMFLDPISSAVNLFWQNDKISLYQYGGVEDSKDNLQNLFRNFPEFIENGKEIDFVSYRYVGTIKTKRDARKYVRKNFKDMPPLGWNTSLEETSVIYGSSVRFHSATIRESKAELKKMANTIAEEYVSLGDEVYAIEFILNLQKRTHYVFINPESKQILLKGNIFGIEIPISHFEHIRKGIE